MKRIFSIAAVVALCGAASFAQYTNVLENGTTQTVTTAWAPGTVWVGNTTSSNALGVIDGGVVSSTVVYVGATSNATDNTVLVTGTGSLDVANTLAIGAGTNNSVTVTTGGSISVGDLVIDSGNSFNLNGGGTFAIATNLDVSVEGFNWNEDGHLIVGGALSGMAVASNTVYLDGGRNLTLDGGTWNTGATNLMVGSGNTASDLAVSGGGWVVVGTGATNDFVMGADGGIAVGGTNGASMLVDYGSTVQTTGGLYVGGTNAALTGSVTVTNGSRIEARSLVVGNDGSEVNIENGGMLSITDEYNFDLQTNVNWVSGGTLSVGGELTKSNGLYGTGHTLVLDGGSWDLGGDLTVSGTNNTLSIRNGGAVTNNDGYVGYAASDSNTIVEVSDNGSTWINNGTLYIGSTNTAGHSVTVSSGGWVEADGLNVAADNDFFLNSGGTLAVNSGFNVAAQSNLVWRSGGTLSVGGGALSGMASGNMVVDGNTNSYTFLGNGRDLTIAAGGTWNIETNGLYVGNGSSGSDLVVENGGWVNVGEVQTNLAGGGSMLVASTNGAQLVVASGSVNVEDTLYLGQGAATGTNIILDGGTVSAGALQATADSLLDLRSGGTFAIAANFDVAATPQFNWGEGGALSVGGALSGMETTNGVYYLAGGRDLTLDGGSWDIGSSSLVVGYGGSGSALAVKNGGMLNSGTTYIGWDTNSADNSVTVSSGSVWTNSGDLWVGYGGTGNSLSILSGGTNLVDGNAYIGNTNAADNHVVVGGSNSLWNVAGALSIGTGSNSVANYLTVSDAGQVAVDGDLYLNSSNRISLASGGAISVDGNMNVYSNATIAGIGTVGFGANDTVLSFVGDGISIGDGIVFEADSGSYNTVFVTNGTFTVAGSNAQQYVNFDELALLDSDLAGAGVIDAFELIDMQGGSIHPGGNSGGTLTITGDFSVSASTSNTMYYAQVFDTSWDQLAFTGTNAVDLSELGIDVYLPLIPTGGVANIITSVAGLDNTAFASTNIEERLLLYQATLQLTNGELNVVVTEDNGSICSTLDYAATESVRAGFAGMKNMVFTRTKQLRRNLVSTSHAIPNEVYLLTSTNAPAGAMGPGDQNTIFDMHVWAQQYSGQGDYDRSGAADGFTLNNNGTTIGADRLVGEALAVGLNYTYARSAARSANRDRLDTETYWIGAYGEWVGVDGLYVDALAGYGYSSYDSLRIAKDYKGLASYNGQAFGAYADVGQYYYYADNLALSPYMGLHALSMMLDAHNEKERDGSMVHVDQVDREWVESVLGLKLRHRFDTGIGRFQTTGYAEWTYDFIQDEVYSTLSSGGLTGVETARVTPDQSGVNVGLGYSWICTDYMEIGVGYNGRFNDDYEEHTGSLMLDMMF